MDEKFFPLFFFPAPSFLSFPREEKERAIERVLEKRMMVSCFYVYVYYIYIWKKYIFFLCFFFSFLVKEYRSIIEEVGGV